MNRDLREYFKAVLQARRDALQQNLARSDQDARTAESALSEVIDQSAAPYSREMLLSQSARERALLRMVEEALSRLRDATFGVCVGCGSEISIQRLRAVPWTGYCIDCQSTIEAQNR